jgi:hypothetical protein|tara:strand:- start:3544 stop:3957 length:414 start_codon:yes stop_codon:yes gene_type:complete
MKILQTLKKLLWGYEEKEDNEYTDSIGISFYLTDSSDIDIICNISDINFENLDEITIFAEKYAELLVLLNNGLLKYQILEIISEYSKDQTDDKLNNKLFADNILSFYRVIENKVQHAKKTKKPLIRPIEVFNIGHEE